MSYQTHGRSDRLDAVTGLIHCNEFCEKIMLIFKKSENTTNFQHCTLNHLVILPIPSRKNADNRFR